MTSLPNSAELQFIDYDLNIFMKEVEDPNTEEYYYDPTSWMVHVYAVDGAGHHEVADPYPLSPEEIRSLDSTTMSTSKVETAGTACMVI